MALLARKKLILAATETTYGVDVSPSGALNAIQTSDLSITPLAGPTVNRNLDRAAFGNDLQIQVGTFVQLAFMVEWAGAGTAGDAPAWGPVLTACGFDEALNVGVDAQYTPNSEDIDSLTIYFHHDGQKHAIVGARGTVSINHSPGTIPKFAFSYTGLYVTPESTADPVVDLAGFVVPLPVNNQNTTKFDLHGAAQTMVECSIDVAGEVVYRNVVGNESVEFIDRAPAGQIAIEAPAISVKDWFESARISETGPLSMSHGLIEGNIVDFDAPLVQLISPSYGESDGIATIQAALSLIPTSAGNDEMVITVK